MNKNVPTLLGIIIILLVALLVIGIYSLMLYKNMAEGKVMTGTKLQGALIGTEAPTEVTAPTAPAPPTEGMPANVGKPGAKPAMKPGEKRMPPAGRMGRMERRAPAPTKP